jgi:4-alpha-glucanotransferase
MKLEIRARYRTEWGEQLYVCGNHELLGADRPEQALPMRFLSAEWWGAEMEFPKDRVSSPPLKYFFFLRKRDGSVVEDSNAGRLLDLSAWPEGSCLVLDSWNDLGTVENVFYTEPFKNVLFRTANNGNATQPTQTWTHRFEIKAPGLPANQTVCVLGTGPVLRDWDTANPVLMKQGTSGLFQVNLDLTGAPLPLAYKYGIYDAERKAFVRYEAGENRILAEGSRPNERVVVRDGFARLPAVRWRGAGVAIPVFSLRSARSFGVGEFLDLTLLAEWAQRVGLKVIQILPVNDTTATHTWMDSYPYAGISALALHPQYLHLDRLAGADKNLLQSIAEQRESLNRLPAIDYEAMMQAKMALIRAIFPSQRESTFASDAYQHYFSANKTWLEPYAAFCFLRDKYGTPDFRQWPAHKSYDAGKVAAMAAEDKSAHDEFALHYFIQFHLHQQLREAAEFLHKRGIILKGDIAIGVHPHGADVWQQPELFHTSMQTGAPPDPFAAKGQNWGFPTYNWPRMKQDGFKWWKRRFDQMSDYFDAFRVDHILGFFRIWSIPQNAVEGILGYFVPARPVQLSEFHDRGITFDRERFTRPYITDGVLQEIFGDQSKEIARRFLNPTAPGRYTLKEPVATQKGVEHYFTSLPEGERDPHIRQGLFDLISNVLFLETPEGELHCRFGLEETSSFRNLDARTQQQLEELSLDYFYRRQEEFWRTGAMGKLPALKRVTNMLICGEDLGMVPACVPDVMKQLGLLSLEIQRMPKTLNTAFSRPADAPYLSVVTPSTHDMSPVRSWWLEDRKVTQTFYQQELKQSGTAPQECESWVSCEVIRQHLASPAMWSIFQLQDLLAMDYALRNPDVEAERINVPAIVPFYWRYRMHLTLEELCRQEDFNWVLENLVRRNGR